MAEARARVPLAPLDLQRTTTLQRMGAYDPTAQARPAAFRKTFAGPRGLVRAELRRDGDALAIELAGIDADDVLAAWLPALPPDDGYEAFAPQHALLRRLHRGLPGMRLLRVPWVWDVACAVILQQRVTWAESCRNFRGLAAHGPREGDARAFPPAEVIADLPSWAFGKLGIDGRRAKAMVLLAREELRRPFLSVATPREEIRERLARIPGIGPWTTALVLGVGTGDRDAVPVGDLHLPHLVAWALAREARGSDERMLELLGAFAGDRFRVVRLLLAAPIARGPSR